MPGHVHEENFKALLVSSIRQRMEEEGLPSSHACNRVVAEWLGYPFSSTPEAFADGADDRGIDFWYAYDEGFNIFQVKTRELLPGGKLNLSPSTAQV
jgi:hypothetical protein